MDWFANALLEWHEAHGRKDLPWQQDINPYRVWVSEIMLQQTQVTTVIDYFQRFMTRFPTVRDLASAELDEVLHYWTGLGYYARARNLYRAADVVVCDYAGEFPQTQEQLEALPGIGRSTAGAIRAIAMHQPATILDGNVKRVLARFHAIEGYPGETKIAKQLWELATVHTPDKATNTYTQAIMDLGATVCTRRNANCQRCPLHTRCGAYAQQLVEQLPTPKPKKAKPVRQARFFVVTLANGVTLLEQKPLDGLWGGLWTPPERSADFSVAEFLDELGATGPAATTHIAPVFRHTFTHFHLEIEPVYLRLEQAPSDLMDADNLRWEDPALLQTSNSPIGLSAPAVKLLASLEEVFS
jgi:A/G-specific adenine glycosylase